MFRSLDGLFVYSLPTKLFAYKPFEDMYRLFLHLVRIMRIKILGDYCIRMTETCSDVDGLNPSLDQTRCMGVTKAVRIQPCFLQKKFIMS